MTRAELIFPLIIFVVVASFTGGGYFIGDYSWGVIAFPLGAAILTCVLCAIEIARLLSTTRASASEAPPADSDDAPLPISASGFAWIFILPLFLYGLGFVAGPAVYLLACLRTNRFSWGLSAGIAAASVAMTWGLFIHLMGVLLPLTPLWWS
ncbi:MAG: hypothetical protein WBW74_08905 [Xanthobacteraceae bacterium]